MTRNYGSRVVNASSIFFVSKCRFVNFEVSYDYDMPLPINHSSISSWQFPEDQRY